MHKEQQQYLIGLGISLLFSIAYVLCIDYISFPWRDEVGTSDTAVNVALYGEWTSHVWKYSYNPLHAFLLIGWLKIWGVSHLTVCSFTVLLAFVGYAVLLKILQKREILTVILSVVVFTLLYWGGFEFARLITLGRTDLLVMLFTILVVNELTPTRDGEFYTTKRWTTLVYAFLLMVASIYSIPVLCCYCLVVYCSTKNRSVRKELRLRFLYAIIGFVVSFIFVCLFFYSVHGLFKFINSYLSFNATINHDDKGRGVISRLVDAYCIDIYALAVLAVTATLLAIKKAFKDQRTLVNVIFALCIPMLMVFAGRYRFYYSWIFYVPVVVLAGFAADKFQKKWIVVTFTIVVAISVFLRPIVKSQDFLEKRAELENVEKFFNVSASYLNAGDNVVFNNSMFYYPIVGKRCNPWHKFKGLQDIPQPEEKFKIFIEKKFKTAEWRDQMLSIFNQMEHSEPYLPESGFIFTEGDVEYKKTIGFMQGCGYHIEIIKENDGFALLKFEKLNL